MGMEVGHPFCSSWAKARFDQGDQRRPGHDRLHFSEEFLTLGMFPVVTPRSTFGRWKCGGELVIREAELLAAHYLSPGLLSRLHLSRGKMGFSRVSPRLILMW